MSFFPQRSPRSRSVSRNTSDRISPIKKRKAKLQKSFQKRMNEVLSKMSEESEDSFTASPTLQHDKKFGGIKNIRLSDFFMDEDELNMSKLAGGTSKSVYCGAGIKLDAFDCFHKVLNECVCDFTFSIADAALILKLLTPDIIKKILPLMSQPTTSSKKQRGVGRKQDNQSEYGEEALDNEISEINKEQKEKVKGSSLKAQTMPKRPDASRSTRLSSPGSNSCSPVSAAVQALISISAPLTGNTITQPLNSNAKLSSSTESNNTEISDLLQTDTFDGGNVFIPLSKPSSTNDFHESTLAPILKPSVVSSSYCTVVSSGYCFVVSSSYCKANSTSSNSFYNNASVTCSTGSEIEIPESMNSVKSESFSLSSCTTSALTSGTTSSLVSVKSSLVDQNLANQYEIPVDTVPSKLLVTSHLKHFPSTTQRYDQEIANPSSPSEPLNCESFDKDNETEALAAIPSTALTHDDPLPHFNLLLNTPGIPVDLPCGLHSPFTHALPPSPMSSMMNAQLETTQVTTSIKDPLPTIPLTNKDISQKLVPHSTTNTYTAIASHTTTTSHTTSVNNQLDLPHTTTISILPPSLSAAEPQTSFIENTEEYVCGEVPAVSAHVRILNPLRTILPKPCSDISSVGVVSVVTSSALSHISPVIKIEEKKPIQYGNSIAPNQIFTKIQPVSNTSSMAPTTLAALPAVQTTLAAIPAQQQRQVFQNQMCYFSPQAIDTFMFSQNQTKETFKNFFAFNQNMPPQMNPIKTKTSDNREVFVVTHNELKSGGSSAKPENRRGNLEVASALLSMASESETAAEKHSGEESFQDIIMESLKKEGANVQVVFTANGTAQIKDIEIDPQEHGIKKGNFTCGRCKRVFTSVMYLTRHIKRVCPDMSQRKWKCDRCTKAFRHPFGLQQHIYTHTGERPHKCGQCAKAFYSSNDLRRHVRTHSGERPYQCTLCDKSFSTTISLKTHNYIHTGERPHKCPHCIKTFATSSKLSRHIVTHSDKRPYPCDQCAKTFNRSGDLRRHYSQHHGNTHGLLECDQCNKVFATQKCLTNHKLTHNRHMEPEAPANDISETQDLLTRTYDVARF